MSLATSHIHLYVHVFVTVNGMLIVPTFHVYAHTHTSTAIGDPPVVIMVGHKLVKEAVSGPSIQLTPSHTTPSPTLRGSHLQS